MIKPICRDINFLKKKSTQASIEDVACAKDLLDTLESYSAECVGMAANMIGMNKRIIVVNIGIMNMIMMNPVIEKKEKPFDTEEGCLSLSGKRKVRRYEDIEVSYMDMKGNKHQKAFHGWTAQIIQHECDHLEGRII